MYKLRNIFTKDPATLGSAFMAVLNVPILVGWLHLAGQAVAGVNVAVVAVLALFVRSRTVPAAALDELHDSTLRAIDLGRRIENTTPAPAPRRVRGRRLD